MSRLPPLQVARVLLRSTLSVLIVELKQQFVPTFALLSTVTAVPVRPTVVVNVVHRRLLLFFLVAAGISILVLLVRVVITQTLRVVILLGSAKASPPELQSRVLLVPVHIPKFNVFAFLATAIPVLVPSQRQFLVPIEALTQLAQRFKLLVLVVEIEALRRNPLLSLLLACGTGPI